MALHTELPIHKAAYDLLGVAVELVKNMPRDFKQSLGGEIRTECLAVLVAIYRANCARDKVPHIEVLIERLQMVILLLRLAKDMRMISTGQFARTIPYTQSIGKQATGWRRSAAPPVSREPRLP
ncbi:MAG: four helix bundle protein [Sterolibacterium sp.]|nr:four helix bundle protein [Sterolibacterium sp.]